MQPSSTSNRLRFAGAIAVVLASLASVCTVHEAFAYCRTTTCDPGRENCQAVPGDYCPTKGVPLSWREQCISYSLQQDATPTVPFDTFAAVTRRAFGTWQSADCGQGARPGIKVEELDTVSCNATEFNPRGSNANIVMFRSDMWDPAHAASNTLALTTVTYNLETGAIYDVDIEVNAATLTLTTTDTNVAYDLESILTHEVGHYFGLAHSSDVSATMYAQYGVGTTGLRTIEPDDVDGICEIYPADRAVGKCNPKPHGGFQEICGYVAKERIKGCSFVTAPSRGTSWASLLACGLVAWAVTRRRCGIRRSPR